MSLSLTTEQLDRAAGVLAGTACGDALGAGYEFGPPRINGEEVAMVGGGPFGWEPGEWTDDTSMAIIIAEVASDGTDLRAPAALDAITAKFVNWMHQAKDVGAQTSQVLSAVQAAPAASSAAAVAVDLFRRTGRTGNGSLMRTAPVALRYLHDEAGLVEAAHAVSSLTHGDREAAEACALWCLAIRYAVLHGNFDGLYAAVADLPSARADMWASRLRQAESAQPHEIDHNGWVVAALMAAWSAISGTVVPADSYPDGHLRKALDRAVRCGGDTDTVAAIAGGLLGARWGASAVPREWRRLLHGWPGLRGRDLLRLALLTACGGQSDDTNWQTILDPDSW